MDVQKIIQFFWKWMHFAIDSSASVSRAHTYSIIERSIQECSMILSSKKLPFPFVFCWIKLGDCRIREPKVRFFMLKNPTFSIQKLELPNVKSKSSSKPPLKNSYTRASSKHLSEKKKSNIKHDTQHT